MYERFQELCRLRGVTVRQVANATGLQESSLSNWKKRNKGISTDTLIKICEYFDVSADWLLTGKDRNKTDEQKNNNYVISPFEYKIIVTIRQSEHRAAVIDLLHLTDEEAKEKEGTSIA